MDRLTIKTDPRIKSAFASYPDFVRDKPNRINNTTSEIKKAIDKDGKAVLHINFDLNKATLKPDGQKVVDEIQKVLEQSPDLKLSIEGHIDNISTIAEKLRNHKKQSVLHSVFVLFQQLLFYCVLVVFYKHLQQNLQTFNSKSIGYHKFL